MNIVNDSEIFWHALVTRLNAAGTFLPQIFLRLIIFWEFWEAGKMKYDNIQEGGEDLQNTIDWFAGLNFPYPFDQISASANYHISMVAEILFAVLILFGLFTRFAAFSLITLTVVATAAVHWPENYSNLSQLWEGYSISNNGAGNYKLPLLYIIMLLPLLFSGAGKFSLDQLLVNLTGYSDSDEKVSDLAMWGLAMMAIGVPLTFLMSAFGMTLAGVGLVLVAVSRVLDPV